MKIAIAAAAACIFALPASAATYCNPNVPYNVETIPHGYAIVHAAYAHYCKTDHMTDSEDYICDGDPEHVLRFKETAGGLIVEQHGRPMEFLTCS